LSITVTEDVSAGDGSSTTPGETPQVGQERAARVPNPAPNAPVTTAPAPTQAQSQAAPSSPGTPPAQNNQTQMPPSSSQQANPVQAPSQSMPQGQAQNQPQAQPQMAINGDGVSVALITQTVPDRTHLFGIEYDESPLSDDDITVENVSKPSGNCLLQKVSTSVEDRTPAVISNLVATVIRAATGVPTAGTVRTGEVKAGRQRTLTAVLDQFGATDTDALNTKLMTAGFDLHISITQIGAAAGTPNQSAFKYQKGNGIYFLDPVPFRLSLSRLSSKGSTLIGEAIFYAHDASTPQFLEIKRSAFVKRETTIVFDSGVPVSIETKKPSELLGFVSIPLEIATDIVSIPGQLIKLRVDYSSQENSLLEDKTKFYADYGAFLQQYETFLKQQSDAMKLLGGQSLPSGLPSTGVQVLSNTGGVLSPGASGP